MTSERLETLKTTSLAHQLIKAGRLTNEKGLENARKMLRLPKLKQLHLELYAYIDHDGTALSEIAKRKGVSKQAVSKLVQEMVEMNLLLIKNDPNDGRSKKVYFKTSGPHAIQKGFKALEQIDCSLKAELGDKHYKMVLTKISQIMRMLEES